MPNNEKFTDILKVKMQEATDAFKASLTRQEFLDGFKAVVEYVKRIDKNLTNKIDDKLQKAESEISQVKTTYTNKLSNLASEYEQGIRQIKEDNKNNLSNVKKFVLDKVIGLFAKSGIDEKINEAQARLDVLSSYEPPNEERITQDASKIALENVIKTIPKIGESIRDSLEELKGNDRLDVSAIKGLEDEINKLTKELGRVNQAVVSVASRTLVGHQEFDGDDSTTDFTLSDAPAAGGDAAWIRLNGQSLDKTVHWTISGNKLSITFTPATGDTISATYIKG